MPAYFSLTFGYRAATIPPDFVARTYESFFQSGFPFKCVYAWGCPADMPLPAIIEWNQRRLERGFELGFTQHVSHDYRQLLLSHPAYRECRLFILALTRQFVLIVPEADVFKDEGSAIAMPEQVAPLESLARSVWPSELFAAVQTNNEIGSAPSVQRLDDGKPASVLPFALLDARCAARQAFDAKLTRLEPVVGGGTFIRSEHSLNGTQI
jgi:hypothetical protein